ncbi:MAG TPA: hypothetical protein VFT84_13025, partial [Gemmatimonadales bacterium]|nr:hypothetical protein [Gemmatimonadales bacterium]
MPALPDVAWLLYMAERLRAGARLYVDLVEVNPPLIVWLNVPAVTLAALLGCSPVLVYRCLVLATAVASCALCARVLAEVKEPSDPDGRRVLLLLVAMAVAVLAGPDFGEREHLLLLLALPYVFLVAARLEARPVGGGLAWLVGLAAGLGIALKPYFVLLPLTLEAALLLGKPRRPVRPETLGIGIVIGTYLAAVQVWAGPYWRIASTLGKVYYEFLQEPVLVTAVAGHGAGLVLFALLAYGTLREPGRNPPLLRVLFLATLAWYGSAVIQRKGWRYHFYPAMSTAFLLLGLLALQARA